MGTKKVLKVNKVVISHYNEDINWLSEIKDNDITIISKTLPDSKNVYYLDKNIGNEASAYLKYIIDNWSNILNYDGHIFLHCHKNSWHQAHDSKYLVEYLANNTVTEEFINFGTNNLYEIYDNKVVQTGDINYIDETPSVYNILKEVWCNIFLSDRHIPTYISLNPGAQFYVRSSNIMSRDINFYINCYNWIMSENLTNYSSLTKATIFEWLWHYIFTDNFATPSVKIP